MSEAHKALGCHTLDNLKLACSQCELCEIRKDNPRPVFGCGPARPKYLLCAEAPGENEWKDGEPFTGKAGKLLMQLIGSELGVTRNEVYLANCLRCRPPENRDPTEEEFNNCTPWLREQIRLVEPSVIVAVGKYGLMAIKGTWDPSLRIGQERGKIGSIKIGNLLIPYVACYHPAYALRNPSATEIIKNDLAIAKSLLNSGGDYVDSSNITIW